MFLRSQVFYGITSVVVAIVAEAVIRIGKKALTHTSLYIFAAMSFIAGQFFSVPFPGHSFYCRSCWPYDGKTVWKSILFPWTRFKRMPYGRALTTNKLPSLWHPVKMAFIFIIIWSAVVLPLIFSKGFGDVLAQQAVFYQSGICHFWRGLRSFKLYIRSCCQGSWMALTEHQMLRIRSCRINTRASDHGDSICGFPRRMEIFRSFKSFWHTGLLAGY